MVSRALVAELGIRAWLRTMSRKGWRFAPLPKFALLKIYLDTIDLPEAVRGWRNGIRAGLRTLWEKSRESSNLSPRIMLA